jgi:hypothetical protein
VVSCLSPRDRVLAYLLGRIYLLPIQLLIGRETDEWLRECVR